MMDPKPTPPETEPEIKIRLCSEADLPALNKAIPEPGYHERRFEAQQEGTSSYLLAWIGDIPVGHLNLKWGGSGEPEIHEFVNDCPELNAIGVYPPEMRSHGIGRKLIATAEAMIKEKGYKQVGIGVETDNDKAKSLYEKLDYVDWGHGIYPDRWIEKDDQGNNVQHNDPCYYLIKTL